MNLRLSVLAGAVALAGALAAGCTSSDSSSADESTTTSSDAIPGMGTAVAGDGATVTVNRAYETDMVEMYADGTDAMNHATPVEQKARDKGKFVIVETTVVNDTDHDMDLTCRSTGGYVDAVLQTDPEAIYQPIQDLRLVPGNPECNVSLGSGFDAEMTWIFEVPEDRKAISFNFLTDSSDGSDTAFIRLDKFGEKTSTSVKAPSPTTDAGNGSIDNEVADGADATPEPVETPEAAAVAPSSPSYGVSCSASQIGLPATGADGTPLVCVGMGANAPARWVYGPEPAGAGTASDGATCSEGEEGGQDESGHMMMCSGGQWVYGP